MENDDQRPHHFIAEHSHRSKIHCFCSVLLHNRITISLIQKNLFKKYCLFASLTYIILSLKISPSRGETSRAFLQPRLITQQEKLGYKFAYCYNLFKFIFWCAPFGYLYFSYFFNNEAEKGARINPGMALTPFPSSIQDETRFKPTTF